MPVQDAFVSADEITNFRMPKPHVGQIVLWYPRAVVEERQARAAIVVQVRHGSVALWEVGAYQRQGVKHVSDPRLRQNEEQRQDGSWEFTPTDLRINRALQLIERIEDQSPEAIESLSRESPARGNAMQTLWELRRKCKDAGHPQWQTLTKGDAEQFLAGQVAAR